MNRITNFFSSRWGIIGTGLFIGVVAALLQKWGNPGNMGVCVACFERDIAGSIGFHRADLVQYMRPEIIGFVIGALIAAYLFKEFRPRGGSSPIIRFVLGIFAMIGALVFLGCPWRALLRLAGGDWNAILGIIGLGVGVGIGALFLRSGYDLGRSGKTHVTAGIMFPLIMLSFLVLVLIFPFVQGQSINGILFYSIKGPGSMHAPLALSLIAGLAIGFVAQRSRFCTMGAFRDLFLFRQTHLFSGIVALVVAAFVTNLIVGQFHPGFAGSTCCPYYGSLEFSGNGLGRSCFRTCGRLPRTSIVSFRRRGRGRGYFCCWNDCRRGYCT